MEIADIIQFEHENTALDFKKEQYLKPSYADLIKDVMSLANADTPNAKLIITGVKHRPGFERELTGICPSDFVDDANYQNIIRENIEPDIEISYQPFEFDGKTFGVLRILADAEKPYMMKKDYQQLKKGDCFIRKGTNQQKALRADFERIYKSRNSFTSTGKISIGFLGTENPAELSIEPTSLDLLPSRVAEAKIKKILDERRLLSKSAQPHELSTNLLYSLATHNIGPFGSIPYNKRNTETLLDNLEHVAETYAEDDLHHLFEVASRRLNFEIVNNSTEYIIDAEIQVSITHYGNMLAAEKVHREPSRSPLNLPTTFFTQNYPQVSNLETEIKIAERIGDIRHHIPTRAFETDIRLVAHETNEPLEHEILVKLFAKNLEQPLTQKLKLKINPRYNQPD